MVDRNTKIRANQLRDATVTKADMIATGETAGTVLTVQGDESLAYEFVDLVRDADGDTKIQVEESADEDIIRFDTGGIERMILNSAGLKLASGADINEFSIDGTLAGNSDDAVPTEKAVKTYVDASAGGGGDVTLLSVTSGTLGNTGDITIQANRRYLVHWTLNGGGANQIRLRFNSSTSANYNWGATKKLIDTGGETAFGNRGQTGGIRMIDDADTLDGANGWLRGHFFIDTLQINSTSDFSAFIWGQTNYRDNNNNEYIWMVTGNWNTLATVTNFEIDFNGVSTAFVVRVFEYANT